MGGWATPLRGHRSKLEDQVSIPIHLQQQALIFVNAFNKLVGIEMPQLSRQVITLLHAQTEQSPGQRPTLPAASKQLAPPPNTWSILQKGPSPCLPHPSWLETPQLRAVPFSANSVPLRRRRRVPTTTRDADISPICFDRFQLDIDRSRLKLCSAETGN